MKLNVCWIWHLDYSRLVGKDICGNNKRPQVGGKTIWDLGRRSTTSGLTRFLPTIDINLSCKKTVFSEKSFLTNKNRLRRWQLPCQTFQFYRPSAVSRDPFPPFFIQGFSLRIRLIKSCSAPNVSKLIANWRQPSQVHMCQACTNISYKLLIVENDKW